ncbi:MAG: formylglycine-generating enzyme family protein [Candidatus Sumerlaeota bacterium]|nr:formylglycine-generating enzyme family protein [Candidatus Sumerlaeota bacterium]
MPCRRFNFAMAAARKASLCAGLGICLCVLHDCMGGSVPIEHGGPRQEAGCLQIACPPNVKIFLDGKFAGVSSAEENGLLVSDVPPGVHHITMEKEGCEVIKASARIQAGAVTRLALSLPIATANLGALEIESLPIECMISIPSLGVGSSLANASVTPRAEGVKLQMQWTIEGLPSGSHRAFFKALGREIAYDIVIQEGQTTRLFVNFAKGDVEDSSRRARLKSVAQGAVSTSGLESTRQPYIETAKDLSMKMIWIPGGTFWMGSRESPETLAKAAGADFAKRNYSNEYPLHEVELDGFWMGATEETVAQWRAFVEYTDYKTEAERGGHVFSIAPNPPEWKEIRGLTWRNPGFPQTDAHPVTCVSWTDAKAFCDWMSAATGKTYRLPTEAQWEYACRAGTRTMFFWGDTLEEAQGWGNFQDTSAKASVGWNSENISWNDGYPFTAPVASFRPNPWGLYDMQGNVIEFCSDFYDEDGSYYRISPHRNPTGPATGKQCVERGGSWALNNCLLRSARKLAWNPSNNEMSYLGFRVVRIPSL